MPELIIPQAKSISEYEQYLLYLHRSGSSVILSRDNFETIMLVVGGTSFKAISSYKGIKEKQLRKDISLLLVKLIRETKLPAELLASNIHCEGN